MPAAGMLEAALASVTSFMDNMEGMKGFNVSLANGSILKAMILSPKGLICCSVHHHVHSTVTIRSQAEASSPHVHMDAHLVINFGKHPWLSIAYRLDTIDAWDHLYNMW